MLSKVFTSREQLLLAGTAAAICVGGITFYVAQPAPKPAIERITVRELQPPKSSPETPEASATPLQDPLPAPPATDTTANQPAQPARKVQVMVSGAITTPGLYELPDTARVSDALKAADGALATADLSDINQAATLLDGSVLTIPVAGTAAIEGGKRMVLRSGESAASLNPAQYTISGWKNAARPTQASSPSTSAASSPNAPTAPASAGGPLDLNTATTDELENLPGVGPKLAQAIIEYRTRQPFQSVDDLNNVAGIGDKKLSDIRPHVRVSSPTP